MENAKRDDNRIAVQLAKESTSEDTIMLRVDPDTSAVLIKLI